MVVSKAGELSLEGAMDYELCSFPPAFFDAQNVFKKADKPQLAKAISEQARNGTLMFLMVVHGFAEYLGNMEIHLVQLQSHTLTSLFSIIVHLPSFLKDTTMDHP